MRHSTATRWTLRLVTLGVLGFLYLPLVIITILSFNTAQSLAWPPSGFTLHWWSEAAGNSGARDALITSLKVATGATALALVLGTLAWFAVQRYRFFGRETVSFLVVLPIALPGIVTGLALNSGFRKVGIELGFVTLIVAHATFCIVVVYNNVLARMLVDWRRTWRRRRRTSAPTCSRRSGSSPSR